MREYENPFRINPEFTLPLKENFAATALKGFSPFCCLVSTFLSPGGDLFLSGQVNPLNFPEGSQLGLDGIEVSRVGVRCWATDATDLTYESLVLISFGEGVPQTCTLLAVPVGFRTRAVSVSVKTRSLFY